MNITMNLNGAEYKYLKVDECDFQKITDHVLWVAMDYTARIAKLTDAQLAKATGVNGQCLSAFIDFFMGDRLNGGNTISVASGYIKRQLFKGALMIKHGDSSHVTLYLDIVDFKVNEPYWMGLPLTDDTVRAMIERVGYSQFIATMNFD